MNYAMKYGCRSRNTPEKAALDPDQAERLKAEVCEKLCKYPEMVSKDCSAALALERLDSYCRDCPLDKF